MRLILTPDDQPIAEASARIQINAEWVNAQHQLASLLTGLPTVATALIGGADMALTATDLRMLADDARRISISAGDLAQALWEASDIASRVINATEDQT